jgi:DNA replication protein DnaC
VWSRASNAAEREAEEKRAEAEARSQRERERLEGLLRASGIPARLQGCTFGTYHASTDGQKEALQVAMDYVHDFPKHTQERRVADPRRQAGNGQRAPRGGVMNALMPEYLPIYTTCLDMIRSVRDTWRKDSKYSETQVLQEYEDAALLIIDEIGVQYGTDGEQTVIFDVLDRRYRQMRPTIFITNQDKAWGFMSQANPRSSASAASTGSSRRRSG